MKFIPCILASCLCILAWSCDPPPPPPEEVKCSWDLPYPIDASQIAIQFWQQKWELKDASGNIAQVPDSFFVSRMALRDLVGENCGFRVYNALEEEGKMSSMGLLFVPMGDDKKDIIADNDRAYLFAKTTSPDAIYADEQGNPIVPHTYLSEEKAEEFMKNWGTFHGTCLENDTLGNSACERLKTELEVSPLGTIPQLLKQLIPISKAYSTSDIFGVVDKEKIDNDAFIFVCAITEAGTRVKRTSILDSTVLVTDSNFNALDLTYNYIIRAYSHSEEGDALNKVFPMHEKLDSTTNNVMNTDQGCPCPQRCSCCKTCPPQCIQC